MKCRGLITLILSISILGVGSSAWGRADHYPGSVWMQYASPEEAGWSSEKLAEARAFADKAGVSALMIIQDGAVVSAWGNIARRYACHSVRKSLLSALYGLYVPQAQIDLDKTLAQLGIDDAPSALTDVEKQAKIRDLLNAKSGVYLPAAYETASMKKKRPARGSHAPGTHWWYNNWDFNVLGTIFEQETGAKIFETFLNRIAKPLQMQDFRLRDAYYHREPEHSRHAAYPFRMSTRDMARFGLFFLRQGRWKEEQLIPKAWVETSTQAHSFSKRGFGYGYMWWTPRKETPLHKQGMYFAAGYGGHLIMVIPGFNTVIVRRWIPIRPYLHRKARGQLTRMLTAARTSSPSANPTLRPLSDPAPSRVSAVTLKPEVLRSYAKTYPLESGASVRLTLDQDELLATTHQGTFGLIPLSPTTFQMEDREQPLFIERDGQGKPVRVVVKHVLQREGLLHLGKENIERAIALFQENVTRFPNSSEAHEQLAIAYLRSGERQRATSHFHQALELNPNNWSVKKQLKELKAKAAAKN